MKGLAAIIDAISWTLFASFFGLLQLFFLMLYAAISKELVFDFNKILQDGVLLFFSSGLVVALPLDYYFSQTLSFPKRVEAILFYLLPGIVVILVTVLYSSLYRATPGDAEMAFVEVLQIGILTFSCIFAAIIKMLMFYQERNLQ